MTHNAGLLRRTVERAVPAYQQLVRGLEWLIPIFDLSVRLYLAQIFWNGGMAKLSSWMSTVMLFTMVYDVPVLPPELAAYLSVAIEVGGCFCWRSVWADDGQPSRSSGSISWPRFRMDSCPRPRCKRRSIGEFSSSTSSCTDRGSCPPTRSCATWFDEGKGHALPMKRCPHMLPFTKSRTDLERSGVQTVPVMTRRWLTL